jgi:hypothetical protein
MVAGFYRYKTIHRLTSLIQIRSPIPPIHHSFVKVLQPAQAQKYRDNKWVAGSWACNPVLVFSNDTELVVPPFLGSLDGSMKSRSIAL